MKNTNGVWTEEKVAQLKKLRAEGHSFGEIAKRLRVSRSSAIAKANRMGMTQAIPTKPGKPKPKLMAWNDPDPRDPEHDIDTRDLAILDELMTGALPGAVARKFNTQESYVRDMWRVREMQETVGEAA